MRQHILALIGSVAVAICGLGTASAADMPAKAPRIAAVAPAFSWAGWYVGVSVGYAMHHSSQTDVGFWSYGSTWDGWSDGVAVGGHIGYNWQFGSFVYGLEADASWLSNKETEFNSFDRWRWKMNWLATFRARAGLAVDRTLLYLTYGLAVAKPKNDYCFDFVDRPDCDDGFASTSKTRVGWVAGAGIEYAPVSWPSWSIRSEFLYASLRRQKTQIVDDGFVEPDFGFRFNDNVYIARLGLMYRWGGGYGGGY